MRGRSWFALGAALVLGAGLGAVLFRIAAVNGPGQDAENTVPVESSPLRALLESLPPPAGWDETGDGWFEGRVVTLQGEPVKNVLIRADAIRTPRAPSSSLRGGGPPPEDPPLDQWLLRSIEQERWRRGTRREVLTDEKGTYRLSGLVHARYWIRAYRRGYTIMNWGPDSFYDAEPDRTVNFIATPVFGVHIRVQLPDGSPPPSATLERLRGDPFLSRRFFGRRDPWSPEDAVRTFEAGTVRLRAVCGRDEEFRSPVQTLTVAEGMAGAEIVFRLRRTSGIRGTVRFPEGMEMAELEAWFLPLPPGAAADPDRLVDPDTRHSGCERLTWANRYNDWVFSFHDLAAGRYLVGLCLPGRSIAAHEIVEVADGTACVDFLFDPGS